MKKIIRILATVAIVLVLDQWSKFLVASWLSPGQVVSILPNFFNLTLTFNTGVAFGMFRDLDSGVRQVLLSATALLALGFVLFLLVREYLEDSWAQVALSLVIGGALGNICDRVRFGHVIDFLDFYYQSYHWPAFNVADSVICVGVVFLIFKKPTKEAKNRAAT